MIGSIPCFFDGQWKNPNVGVVGPDAIIERHLQWGSTYNGNTELPVSMVLYALALANDAQIVAETGVNNAAGATLWLVMASMANLGAYCGIDIQQDKCSDASAAIGQSFPDAVYQVLCGDALTVLPERFKPGTIDLLFVDDNHTREHVAAEVEAFLPLMKPGGLMCFHDIIGVHEHDVWDVIEPLGAIKLVGAFHRPDHKFGGLGVIRT